MYKIKHLKNRGSKILGLIGHGISTSQQKILTLVKEKERDSHLKPNKVWLLGIGWTLIGTLSAGITWLAISETDEIVNVNGIITPSDTTLDVQVPEGGVIDKIYVKEGQKVKEGMLLVELDNRKLRNELKKIEQQIETSTANLNLLKSSANLIERKYKAQKISAQKSIDLFEELQERLEKLLEKGATSEVQVLQQKDKLRRAKDQLEMLKIRQLTEKNEMDSKIEDLTSELNKLQADFKNQSIRIEYSQIRSTTDGYVFDLKPKSKLNVARTSTTLMQILSGGEMKLKVKIPSKNIGLIKEGLKAEVSIDSYPANEFGTIEGNVVDIALDAATESEMNGGVYYIKADVKLSNQHLNARGVKLGLRPGMTARANIKLRKVKYLELLLGSFRDKSKSLREVAGKG